ncbi:MAG: hypothetical protein SGPRY_010033 [Prymnesium sp.]
MAGRRLSDGAIVSEARWRPRLAFGLVVGCMLLCCPSHSSFTLYLTSAASDPSDYLVASLSQLTARQLWILPTAQSQSYLAFRIGSFREQTFLGLCGLWIPLPSPHALCANLEMLASELTCGHERRGRPHEGFVLLCAASLLLWHLFPSVMRRHSVCSRRALSSGRVWTVLLSNLSHPGQLSLLHHLLLILQLGPVLLHAVGCHRLFSLLLSGCLAASSASILWNGWLARRPASAHEDPIGASGVGLALASANAALFPHSIVSMYGIELSPAGVLVLSTLLDAVGWLAQGRTVDLT